MNSIAELFQYPSIAKILVDSLPGGLLIIDDQARVQAANKFLERILGISRNAIMGNMIGQALGCLQALENPKECAGPEYCDGCEVASMGIAAINQNQAQKARIFLQLVNNGQIRDVDFLVNAVPFSLKDQQYCIFLIEDIPGLPEMTIPTGPKGFRGIVGKHTKMKELFRTIRQVARTKAAILLQGETGTGKELVALAIHKESPRARKYFVPINCGALPEGLLESELFGHVKGAFTGAIRDKKGRFELADGGTLFLDEVGELSASMQVKLLRVLQDGKFQPVGSEKTLQTDVRILSATNKNLDKEVATGRFRKDLYYRLSAMLIHLPLLRDRSSDIPLLAEHFLAHYDKEFFNKKAILSSETVSVLMAYDWPGNVRELKNAIHFSLASCMGKIIKPSHLPQAIRFAVDKPFTVRRRQPTLGVEDVMAALKKTSGNKSQAAELLGVSRATLYRFFAKQEDQAEG